MSQIYVVPEWFFTAGVLMELLFAIVAALVAFYSIRIYNLSGQRESRLFAAGFISISLSYLLKAAINFFVLGEVKEAVRSLDLQGLNNLELFGVYAHIILFTIGLVTLAYTTFKVNNRRSYALTMALAVTAVLASSNVSMVFNLVTTLIVLAICVNYALDYGRNENHKTLMVLVAFITLFVSGVESVFIANYYLNYVIGHFLELAFYLIILVELFSTIRKK